VGFRWRGVVRKMLDVTLSVDHDLIDSAPAARFA
jgi:pyruvate/2-oxoglutarate dehydrogenase complex dihydrolipoamide acyltransferase (E2) component